MAQVEAGEHSATRWTVATEMSYKKENKTIGTLIVITVIICSRHFKLAPSGNEQKKKWRIA